MSTARWHEGVVPRVDAFDAWTESCGWEIETPAPEKFMRFHAALSEWAFSERHRRTSARRPTRACTSPSTTSRPPWNASSPWGTLERPRVELGGDDRWFGVYRDPTGVSFGMWTANPEQTQG